LTFKLFNSYGRKLMAFRPLQNKKVRMYTCGPTVWDYAHIGNFRTFLFEELLRRYLKFKGYTVVQVMNITDVEDKIIKGMKRTGKSLEELTHFYEDAFMQDLDTLSMERAEYYPRATEHIKEMLALIKVLLNKGYAYRSEDGSIYFNVRKFRNYGKLSGIRIAQLRAGARVSHDSYDKEEASDFALWKAWDKDDGDVFWATEFGKGRPGWSIECSAMSMKYLGNSFDIHAGGADLKFPHHENEIAQSEAATGRRYSKYWLHSEFLNLGGEEMHKTTGNIVQLRDLLQKGWDPMTIRLFLLSAHYREPLSYTEGGIRQSDAERQRLQDFIARLRSFRKTSPGSKSKLARGFLRDFETAMDDDLNTPKAFAVLFTLVKRVNGLIDSRRLSRSEATSLFEALGIVNSVLGFMRFQEDQLPPRLRKLVKEREEARRTRDFAAADRIRQALVKEGVTLEDTPTGTVWRVRRSRASQAG
jgi:cysteinyl-tRNA synthetase